MKPLNTLRQFLRRHADRNKPLLCALSGGADSLCLFYLLLECRSLAPHIHVAHVDHQWRAESAAEAKWLKDLAASHEIPYFLKTLNPKDMKGNLEDASRMERINFFIECARESRSQAVLLGHHADDQAETILKRVFEGAPLNKVSSLKAISNQRGVPFWRPLLDIPKREIIDWMNSAGHEWLEDPTNTDAKYLRGKMRLRLIPWLSEEFGKNISRPLCRFAAELEEVEEYLKRRTARYVPNMEKDKDRAVYDFTVSPPSDPLEWKTVVRAVCEQESFPLSRSQLYDVVRLLSQKSADKWIESAGRRARVHLGRLIFSAGK